MEAYNEQAVHPERTTNHDQEHAPTTHAIELGVPEHFLNRYVSLLNFNARVLEQAEDPTVPLFERLRFLLIFSSNMDEFFEIRMAGLQREITYSQARPEADGMAPSEVLRLIRERCHEAITRQYALLNDTLLPALAVENIHVPQRDAWTARQVQWIKHYYRQQVAPVLTPIGLDLAHPFPRLVNKSLNFLVSLEGTDAFGRQLGLAVIPAPKSLPRLIRLPEEICEGNGEHFVFLSSIIHYFAGSLFPGMKATGCYQFRLTRNADLLLDEEKVEDLSIALRGELFSRGYGEEVRLEVADNMPQHMVDFLLNKFGLSTTQLYPVNGPVNLTRMMPILDLDRPELKFTPYKPSFPKPVQRLDNIFETLSNQDVLLNHPYESFVPVINLLRQAARDPKVVAIKQTLYRAGRNSEMLDLLVEAARNGKEVTAIVELRARFDEESNLEIASRLHAAGAVVVYGVVNYKTHAKMMLIVRREGPKLKRYIHLGTGNYHSSNARLYTDYSLLTANDALAEDVHKIFQELTGMGRAARLEEIYHAPFTLRDALLDLIETERTNKLEGKPAGIIMKVNALTEKGIIEALYSASAAGVDIQLIVRGQCTLRPGIPGISETITVRSIVGRFLEHVRIFYFHQAGAPRIYCASSDLMDRNLHRRIEICFPILDAELAHRVYVEGLQIYLEDNCQAWVLQNDGSYLRQTPAEGEERKSAQDRLMEKLG
ncbi:Polyphosphate kinase [gamma proteobacterium HdN1]|nr:Polyphosphate kinase [gamma proteobacterium HdN1]